MNIRIPLLVTVSVLLSACASNPKDIHAAYVSPLKYKDYDCDQIAMEMDYVGQRTTRLHQSLEKENKADKWQMGVGLILFWPTLFALEGGDGPEATEYAQLKGEFEALRTISVQKRCGYDNRTFKSTVTTAMKEPTSEAGMQDVSSADEVAPNGLEYTLNHESAQTVESVGYWTGKTSQDRDISIKVEIVDGSLTVTRLKYAINMKGAAYSVKNELYQPAKLLAKVTDGKFSYSGSDYEVSGTIEGSTLKGNLSATNVHPDGLGTATGDVTFVLNKANANSTPQIEPQKGLDSSTMQRLNGPTTTFYLCPKGLYAPECLSKRTRQTMNNLKPRGGQQSFGLGMRGDIPGGLYTVSVFLWTAGDSDVDVEISLLLKSGDSITELAKEITTVSAKTTKSAKTTNLHTLNLIGKDPDTKSGDIFIVSIKNLSENEYVVLSYGREQKSNVRVPWSWSCPTLFGTEPCP